MSCQTWAERYRAEVFIRLDEHFVDGRFGQDWPGEEVLATLVKTDYLLVMTKCAVTHFIIDLP